MTTRTRVLVLRGDADRIAAEDLAAIAEAAASLKRGELVAFPTETVYGLGALATDPAAVDKVFAVKRRPNDNPLIVHVADLNQAAALAEIGGDRVARLAEAFWPGPLTLVLPAKAPVRDTVCRGLATVAVRVPDHAAARALIASVSEGLAAPSANLSGRPSPTRAAHVLHDLAGKIPLVLDGGPCAVGIESTVLDMTADPPVILRPGTVTAAMLRAALGGEVASPGANGALERSPGTRYRHYSPDVPVWTIGAAVPDRDVVELLRRLCRDPARKPAYLGWRPLPEALTKRVRHVPRAPGAADLARGLYGHLRDMERFGRDVILIDMPPRDEAGLGVLDRLGRAASRHFETAAEVAAWLAAPWEEAAPDSPRRGSDRDDGHP